MSYLESKGLLDIVLSIERKPRANATGGRNTRSTANVIVATVDQVEIVTVTTNGNTETITPQEAWRRRNAHAKTIIMSYCSQAMKMKIIDLETAHEQWETLKKDCRPLSDTAMSTYTNQFNDYQPKKGTTIDMIANDLSDLYDAIVTTDKREAPTEKAKIRVLF